MAVAAPFCNVTIFTPSPGPTSPNGFRMLSPNATLPQVIDAFNNNFSPSAQDREFERQLGMDIARGTGSRTGGFTAKPSQVGKAAQKEISKLKFLEKSIVRKKMKVTNPENKAQYIIDDRVVAMVMRDERTGALWIFEDKKAAKGVSAGSEEFEGTNG